MNAKQLALTTVALMAVIVIVTLVRVGLGGRGDSNNGPKGGEKVLAKTHLTVPIATIPDADPQRPIPPPFAETNKEGHYDFWFTNDNDEPVEVFLSRVSCGQCVSMKIGLAPEDWQAAQARAAAPRGPAAAFGEAKQATPEPGPGQKWVPLIAEVKQKDDGPEKDEAKKNESESKENVGQPRKSVEVPPKGAGWLRLVWHNKEMENLEGEWLGAVLRTTCKTGAAPPIEIKVMVRLLKAVRVVQPTLPVSPIASGSGGDKARTAWFQVYSATRDRFPLKPAEQKKANPFVTCGDPLALSESECRTLAMDMHLPVRCGYKVPVTVREQADGQQHDLGPFSESVALTSDAMSGDLTLTITGTVEGLVTVLCGETKDNIALGSFPRSTGTRKTILVETVSPGADVTLALDKVPDFLDVSDPEAAPSDSRDGLKRWIMHVSVKVAKLEEHGVIGSLEEAEGNPAVFLKANGRRLRIPVTGTVLRQ